MFLLLIIGCGTPVQTDQSVTIEEAFVAFSEAVDINDLSARMLYASRSVSFAVAKKDREYVELMSPLLTEKEQAAFDLLARRIVDYNSKVFNDIYDNDIAAVVSDYATSFVVHLPQRPWGRVR